MNHFTVTEISEILQVLHDRISYIKTVRLEPSLHGYRRDEEARINALIEKFYDLLESHA